jgi:hypothetical protein
VSLAASLRLTAQRLIRQYGEAASLVRVAVTGSETGTTVQTPTTYTFTAALTRRGKSLQTTGETAVLREFSRGGRVLAGDEEAMVAAADLAVEPKPSDRFFWGATARRVVDVDVYRVQGVDIAYRMGLVA